MSVDLGELLPALTVALNVPGDGAAFFDMSDDTWIDALELGFWSSWLLGFYKDYRISVAGGTIENINGGDDLPRGDQQILVLQTALTALENKLATLPTQFKNVAGPVSTEAQRSSQVLKDILDARRADLVVIRDTMQSVNATSVAVIDAILARTGNNFWVGSGAPWVNG